MSLWTIEPRDPLVVRDGRPNNGRSESAALPFPHPSTIAGIVRTRLGSNEGGVFDTAPEHLGALLRVGVHGPLLAKLDGALYAPPPRDALVSGGLLRRLAPIDPPPDALFDAELYDSKPIGLARSSSAHPAGKTQDRLAWWPWDVFERWLSAPHEIDGVDAKALLSGGLPALPEEVRGHVKLADTWTAEEGMLFQTSGLRFTTEARERLALAFEVHGPLPAGRALRSGIGPFGGKRRLVHMESAPALPWPRLSAGVRAAVADEGAPSARVRVVLLTPGIFAAGHRPGAGEGQLLGARVGVKPRLLAMCVPRPITISGWDFAAQRPKKTRRMVPAGSVYWLDLEGEARARVAWAEDVMMVNVSDEEQDRLDGFGLAAVGVAS